MDVPRSTAIARRSLGDANFPGYTIVLFQAAHVAQFFGHASHFFGTPAYVFCALDSFRCSSCPEGLLFTRGGG